MHSQEINLLLDFDSKTGSVKTCKIIPNIKELILQNTVSLIKVENESSERSGECSCCSTDFEVFLYQTNNNKYESVHKTEEAEDESIVVKEEIFVEELQPDSYDFSISKKHAKEKKVSKTGKKKYKANVKVEGKPSEDENAKCEHCKSEFKNKISLNNHLRVCNVKIGIKRKVSDPQCSYCKKIFKKWGTAFAHERRVHMAHRYTCEVCGYSTPDKPSFNEHVMKDHKNIEKPFMCDLCPYRCSRKNGMRQHIKLKHLKIQTHICEICAKVFTNLGSLKIHNVHRHNDERNYQCKDCDKSFKTGVALNAHHYKMHVPLDQKVKYSCEVCDFFTFTKFSFKNHMGTHVDSDKCPFKCHLCNKCFASKYSLRDHHQTHSDYRPFNCEFCEKSFRRKADLKMHTRYHTGEKPYECEICGQRYSDRGCYRSHLIVHEKQLGIVLDKSVKKFINNKIIPSENK